MSIVVSSHWYFWDVYYLQNLSDLEKASIPDSWVTFLLVWTVEGMACIISLKVCNAAN